MCYGAAFDVQIVETFQAYKASDTENKSVDLHVMYATYNFMKLTQQKSEFFLLGS